MRRDRGRRRMPRHVLGLAATLSAQVMHAWEHTIWGPAVVLALATVLTAVASEALVGSIEPVAAMSGLARSSSA